jgi:hypothetical protein
MRLFGQRLAAAASCVYVMQSVPLVVSPSTVTMAGCSGECRLSVP